MNEPSIVRRAFRTIASGGNVTGELAPAERRPALVLALAFLLASLAAVVGRIAADSLLLAQLDPRELPWLYGVSAVASSFLGGLVFAVRRRLAPELLFPVTAVLFGSGLLLARFALGEGASPWLLRGLFCAVEVAGVVSLVQLWLLVDDAFPERQETRFFRLVEAAGGMAALLGGGAVALVSPFVATENLLLASGAGFWLAVVPGVVVVVQRARLPRRPPPAGPARAAAGLRTGQRLLIAAIFLLGIVATVLADFVLKTQSLRTWEDPRQLAQFFGQVACLAGGVALALQTAARARLGFLGILIVAPLVLATGAGLFAVNSGLWNLGLACATGVALRFSILDTTIQRAFLAVPRRLRDDARLFVETLLRPAAVALAGSLIVASLALPDAPQLLSWGVVGCSVGLVGLVVVYRARLGPRRLRRASRGAGAELLGEGGARAVIAGLCARELKSVESALEVAHLVPDDLTDLVAPHLGNEEPKIRRLAAQYLADRARPELAATLRQLVGDRDPAVRAVAIRGVCALEGKGAVDAVAPFLEADNALVAAAAATGLVVFAEGEGSEALARLLGSVSPEEREATARALGAIGARAYIPRAMHALLEDPDPRVRGAAIEAAGRIRAPELLPRILAKLSDRRAGWQAELALERYGEDELAGVLVRHASDRAVLTRVFRILGRLGSPQAVRLLVEQLHTPDEEVRSEICHALSRAVRNGSGVRLPKAQLSARCLVEVAAAYRTLAAAEVLGLPEAEPAASFDPRRVDRQALATELLRWALDEKARRTLERLFLILGSLYPHVPLSAEPAQRAVTLEALDTIPDAGLRRRIRPLLEWAPRRVRLLSATGILAPPRKTRDDWLRELLSDESSWVVTCAIAYAGAFKVSSAKDTILALLERPSAVLRETALEALEALVPIHELPRAIAPLLWDDFAPIRRRVDKDLERIIDQVELNRAHGSLEEAYRT